MKKITLIIIALSMFGFLMSCDLSPTIGSATPVARALTADGQGTNNGYFYSLWHSGGSVSMTLGSSGNYAINWSGVGDMTCGKGWNPGSARNVNYNCGAFNGNVFGVYGWTTGPLIEYYVCEMGSAYNNNGTACGSVSSDGGSYNVYIHQQKNQPSINGTQTFWQYISVRNGSNSQGANHTVSMGNHINYWKAHCGQGFGSFNYMILLTEAWNSSGYANATVW